MESKDIERSLAWVELSNEVFKDSNPMATEERAFVNEFFWKQFPPLDSAPYTKILEEQNGSLKECKPTPFEDSSQA